MPTKRKPTRQVRLVRTVHPVYAAHLERLESVGIDLAGAIIIASCAVTELTWWPPKNQADMDSHEHRMMLGAAAAVNRASAVRDVWETHHDLIGPPKGFSGEDKRRIAYWLTWYQSIASRLRRAAAVTVDGKEVASGDAVSASVDPGR